MTFIYPTSANRFRFRAWHKKLRKMVLLDEMSICEEYSTLSFGASDGEYAGIGNLPGSYCLNEKSEHDISVDCENMDNWTVMQSTGLTDKNNVELFEGDIICFDDGSAPDEGGGNYLGRIVFDNAYASFRVEARHDKCTVLEWLNELPEFEKVGDVYSNPELWAD